MLIAGLAKTEIVFKDGLVTITKTQTTRVEVDEYSDATHIELENPVVTTHVYTVSHFTENILEELIFAFNIDIERTMSFVNSIMQLMEMMGMTPTITKVDLGELLAFGSDESGYDISVNLGKMLGMDGGLSVRINRTKQGETDKFILTSLNIDVSMSMFIEIFQSPMPVVDATITMTNNNPGQVVDFSAFHAAVSDTAKTFGCPDFAALAQKVADNGGVLKTPEPAPEPEPAA